MKKYIFGALFLVVTGRAEAFSVEVSQDAAREVQLTIGAIRSATKSLKVNIYELKSQEIADALQRRIEEGLSVEILEEGQPVGGLSENGKEIRARLAKAMSEASASTNDKFFVMTSQPDRKVVRRYHFDHAKYIVVDDEHLLLGSENYSGTLDPSAKHPGNRGWQVLAHERTLAKSFAATFADDTAPSHDDIYDLVDRTHVLRWVSEALSSFPTPRMQALLPTPQENQTMEAESAERILSPESLEGLVRMLDGAQKSIDLELMTFSQKWGSTGKLSPLYSAVLRAARRGVRVRALLNDNSVFAHPHTDDEDTRAQKKDQNAITVAALSAAAKKEGLDIQATIADVEAMGVAYIHNKGALVDDDKVLVSSINWNQNSVEKNREAALVITSRGAHEYYRALFEEDWKVSTR